jgi:hypothetical protein
MGLDENFCVQRCRIPHASSNKMAPVPTHLATSVLEDLADLERKLIRARIEERRKRDKAPSSAAHRFDATVKTPHPTVAAASVLAGGLRLRYADRQAAAP